VFTSDSDRKALGGLVIADQLQRKPDEDIEVQKMYFCSDKCDCVTVSCQLEQEEESLMSRVSFPRSIRQIVDAPEFA
jgi:hypothetical protein